jgi:DDE superfamily endonuclease
MREMLDLPKKIIQVLRPFERVFSERVWEWVKVLLVGAILAPGQRTVASVLRVMGLSDDQQFQNYHRVLNRAKWSSRALSRIVLQALVHTFVSQEGPIVVGIDETIERRRGAKITAKGIYRDPVRSSKEFFVKTSGLRWVSMMLLVPIPWVKRVWALPFLTVLAPSERYAQQRKRRHKKITDWGRQMIRQLRRWVPDRYLVVVADSSYAVLTLLACAAGLSQPVTVITRLRLDAALFDPAPERETGTIGRPRRKGARQPTLAQRLDDPHTEWQTLTVPWYGGQTHTVELATGTAVWYHKGLPLVTIRWVLLRDPQKQFPPQGLLCTDVAITPTQIVAWFVSRWPMEVTFHEVRAHLGVETQRQWSDLAILRTTPTLLGLFSLVTLFAHGLLTGEQAFPIRQAAWYSKTLPTFADTLAFVRQHLWPVTLSYLSPAKPDMIEIPRALFERLTETLAFAA